ncbi:MAG: methionyl-tRNA formyltransferase [Porticoccaceae bacterium]
MRVVFAGTPEFAAHHLQALLDASDVEVVAVYTQPDRPAGRGKKLTPSPVKVLAEKHQLPVHQPLSLKSAEEQQILANYGADIMVVVAYGLILPRDILVTPRLGCINVHASLLPRWRGAAPIQRTIEAGDRETGVTIMQMDVGLDTGDMLLKAHCVIEDADTASTLHDKLAGIGPSALLACLQELADGTAVAEKQDDAASNYAPKITKEEAELDWSKAAADLDLKIRALNPFPVCFTTVNGERVRIWEATPEPHTQANVSPGTICRADREGIRVQTGAGQLLIRELQLPGKKQLGAADVLNAYASLFAPGTVLGQ